MCHCPVYMKVSMDFLLFWVFATSDRALRCQKSLFWVKNTHLLITNSLFKIFWKIEKTVFHASTFPSVPKFKLWLFRWLCCSIYALIQCTKDSTIIILKAQLQQHLFKSCIKNALIQGLILSKMNETFYEEHFQMHPGSHKWCDWLQAGLQTTKNC